MNFRKVNNITGWVVFLIALATYMLTREARGSLWDCGEFVSSAYKMELPHPPGAPMFTLIGRFFIILFGDNAMTAANAVNFMSALASAATILFLFWSITHFARKMFVKTGEELTGQQIFTSMVAGAVGALAYTFSDSFWYSAVEGEVYALSSFFTALVFWSMLKWEHADENAGTDPAAKARADRWIVFLFFMMGLSIGVHLLNLLTLPAVIMIYYFRRYFKFDAYKADAAVLKKDQLLIWTAIATIGIVLLLVIANVLNKENDLMGFAMILSFIGGFIALVRIYTKYKTIRNIITAFVVGCLVTGIVQVVVIQYSMKAAGMFDIFFVDSMGMPFFSGFTIYFIALAALIAWAFTFNANNLSKQKLIIWFVLFLVLSVLPFIIGVGEAPIKIVKFLLVGGVAALIGYFIKGGGLRILKLSLWCYAFMMLGYFMYFTVMIRSSANPAIDMNNVDNPISLVYYLSREQYGSAPLIYGPHFDAQPPNDLVDGDPISYGEMQYFKGNDRYVATEKKRDYNYKSSVKQLFPRIWDPSNDQGHYNFYISWLSLEPKQTDDGRQQYTPTYADNANFFFTYQMDMMYWRYFMWNFAGKQNDNQGSGNVRDGNWISGISFIDNTRLGDQSKMPDSLKHNKAHNSLFMLPFILGILGCVYQFMRYKKDWAVTFLLFFMTGIAVVFYLNQPGIQPRERDYAYVGSFYAFAFWIGLAVVAFVKMAQDKADKKGFNNVMIYGSALTFIVTIMSSLRGSPSSFMLTGLFIAALFYLVCAGITYLVRAVSSGGTNLRMLNIATAIICLVTPLIMAQQEWDDHDRSGKTLAPDLAKDYLESCAPNAILFTFGDNDTYPLWYEQEVEGVRPDIRIINYSLLGIDWYINQLRYKINQSNPIDVIWGPELIEGGKRDYVIYSPRPNFPNNVYYDLFDLMKNYVGTEKSLDMSRGDSLYSFPVTKVSVKVDRDSVLANKSANPTDTIVPEMRFDLPQKALMKNDLAILNIIASNNWRRPIYFTSPFDNLGFVSYLRKDGLTYRLVPTREPSNMDKWVVKLFDTPDNLDVMKDNLMNKFVFDSKRNTYFDEENRRHQLNIRGTYAEAVGNLADANRKDDALKVLAKGESLLPENLLPYAMTSRGNSHNITGMSYLEACYKAGNTDLARKVGASLRKDMEQQKRYYEYIKANREEFYGGFTSQRGGEAERNDYFLQLLDQIEQKYDPTKAKPTVSEGNTSIQTQATVDSMRIIDSIRRADSGKKKRS